MSNLHFAIERFHSIFELEDNSSASIRVTHFQEYSRYLLNNPLELLIGIDPGKFGPGPQVLLFDSNDRIEALKENYYLQLALSVRSHRINSLLVFSYNAA